MNLCVIFDLIIQNLMRLRKKMDLSKNLEEKLEKRNYRRWKKKKFVVC